MRKIGIAITICVIWQFCAGGQELTSAARPFPAEPAAPEIRAVGFSTTTTATTATEFTLTVALEVPDSLRPIVERMWRTSPTFRRQCTRLAEVSLRIMVRLDPHLDLTKANAVTTIDVRESLVRSVSTRLGSLTPEHLAHEIEHVLEQLDGIDIRRAVQNGLLGVHEASRGFETARAIAIGRLVAHEMGWEEK
jgi:hypothetical protein